MRASVRATEGALSGKFTTLQPHLVVLSALLISPRQSLHVSADRNELLNATPRHTNQTSFTFPQHLESRQQAASFVSRQVVHIVVSSLDKTSAACLRHFSFRVLIGRRTLTMIFPLMETSTCFQTMFKVLGGTHVY